MFKSIISALLVSVTPLPAYATSLAEMAVILENGTWAWPEGQNTCAKNPQTITFSDDLMTMKISWKHTHGPAIYEIIKSGPRNFTSKIQGETRRTEEGSLFVWQLHVLSPTSFRWQRTDWPSHVFTKSQVKCGIGDLSS
ncbi:hypothetical protein [uncultured Litoreibacter sp.]|uniref:hypothetical protein n=1 Tax=uncultured Litoreibacter sp. TaxID=1392394 RepID=UPI00261D7BFD|nr:hypothetical protein [uncultured Litoreibacter sp.]